MMLSGDERMRLATMVALLTPCLGLAQSGDSSVAFEAASVKPAGPAVSGEVSGGMHGGPGTSDPGRISIHRGTLSDLLARAYDVERDQISGPAWIEDRETYAYRIDATIPPNTTKQQFQLMFQSLLAERFHVRLHHETKTRPGYELVVASGGPKLKEWNPDATVPAGGATVDEKGFLKLPAGSGLGFVMPKGGGVGAIQMSFRQTMAQFCHGLGADINMANGVPIAGVQPRVIDKTGLTATYEFTLEFAGSMRPSDGEPGASSASDPTGAPNIFTAVEKQLGLKLVKVPDLSVDMVIVDSADKVPAGN
jgi:uncharacterized protein (TIGR03435 family)